MQAVVVGRAGGGGGVGAMHGTGGVGGGRSALRCAGEDARACA